MFGSFSDAEELRSILARMGRPGDQGKWLVGEFRKASGMIFKTEAYRLVFERYSPLRRPKPKDLRRTNPDETPEQFIERTKDFSPPDIEIPFERGRKSFCYLKRENQRTCSLDDPFGRGGKRQSTRLDALEEASRERGHRYISKKF